MVVDFTFLQQTNMWCSVRGPFTSLKCISDEVNLPLWTRNSEYPFMVEAWRTHAFTLLLHIHTCLTVHTQDCAHIHKQVLSSAHSHCPKLPQHGSLLYQKKTDSPWRFMKRMQLSTTTGICCPELWRREMSRGEMRWEEGVKSQKGGPDRYAKKGADVGNNSHNLKGKCVNADTIQGKQWLNRGWGLQERRNNTEWVIQWLSAYLHLYWD